MKPEIFKSKKYRTIEYNLIHDSFGYSVIAFKSICIENCGTFQTYEEALKLFDDIGKKKIIECEHNWVFIEDEISHYKCTKCRKLKR
jgi:hypothetical protein